MNTATDSMEARLAFTLGDRLAKALAVANMSNQDMAEALDVSRNTVSNYINGNTHPKRLYLKEWAVRTGVPPEWLETGHVPHGPESKMAPTRKSEGQVEPPAVLETATFSLQARRLATVTPLRRAA